MSDKKCWRELEAEDELRWVGGEGTIAVFGSFNGETVTFQLSPDDGDNWVSAGDYGILTTGGSFNFSLPPKTLLRLHVTGGDGAGLLFRIGDVKVANRFSQLLCQED